MFSLKFRFLLVGVTSMLVLNACNADEGSDKATKTPAAETKAPAAVTVNGTAIRQPVLDMLVKERTAQGQPDTPELRKSILDELVVREVIAQEATKKGLDKSEEMQLQFELAKQSLLLRTFLGDYVKEHPATDDMLKAEYDKIKAQLGDKQYHVRHILVPQKKEAEDIIAQLKKGAKFDKLAKEKSKDPGSAAKGGDLDWISKGDVVPQFGDAVVKLQKGKYTTEPVQSPFGWHVIKLEDERAAPAFEAVKDSLRQRVQQEQVQKVIADLKAKAKIEGLPVAAPAAPAPAKPAEKK